MEKEIIVEIGMFIDCVKIILQIIFFCEHKYKEVILFPKEETIFLSILERVLILWNVPYGGKPLNSKSFLPLSGGQVLSLNLIWSISTGLSLKFRGHCLASPGYGSGR